MTVDGGRFAKWLDAYGECWVQCDTDRLLTLFTDDATYMFTPMHPLMRGKAEIDAYARKGTETLQKDIEFSYEMLAVHEPYGLCRWRAALTWVPTGDRIRFDGIYQPYLNEEGLCYRFDEWWHSDPQLPEENAPGS